MLSYAHIVRKLKALPKERDVKIGEDKATMICSWHKMSDGSREKTGSFIINLKKFGAYLPGSGRCFSCQKYVKDFRIICDPALEGESSVVEDEEDARAEPLFDDRTLSILSDEDVEIKLPNAIPWNTLEHWRGVNGKLLKLIDAKLIFEEEYQNLMAYLPCVVGGQHIGGIRANLVKKGKRNYFNLKGPWVKDRGLFPFDTTVQVMKKFKYKTIVIVEGPRDALKCLQLGIPAVAVLGTGNWSESKADLIANLDINKIIVALDGDKAGKDATKKIYASFRDEFEVQRFNFEKYGKDIDPGCASKAVMAKLKSYVV